MANKQRALARQAAVNRREFAAALGDRDCPVEPGWSWEKFHACCLARLEVVAKKRAERRSTEPRPPSQSRGVMLPMSKLALKNTRTRRQNARCLPTVRRTGVRYPSTLPDSWTVTAATCDPVPGPPPPRP